ncbi:MAG TPA: hypothetical protein PLO33_18060 [Kouleothrix sp.]|uniref:hypothetical protein n=1 Tax=Kouleothrix sp. TaxID=2779161 RepID=UPI002B7C1806|nr:hypothetical protein [Kouleothrix sp.]HRC77594.1 hypothetical protein [Kouleothrix sp.]
MSPQPTFYQWMLASTLPDELALTVMPLRQAIALDEAWPRAATKLGEIEHHLAQAASGPLYRTLLNAARAAWFAYTCYRHADLAPHEGMSFVLFARDGVVRVRIVNGRAVQEPTEHLGRIAPSA